MYFLFFSFSGGEIFLVVLAVLVLFGAKKIPELARTLGKGMNEFRKATDELKREFKEGTEEFTKDLNESKKDIEEHVKNIGQNMSDPIGFEPYEELESNGTKSNNEADENKTQPRPNANNEESNQSDNKL